MGLALPVPAVYTFAEDEADRTGDVAFAWDVVVGDGAPGGIVCPPVGATPQSPASVAAVPQVSASVAAL